MELATAMRERRSVRAFLDEEVPEPTVRRILDEARWAPSWANAQGWDVIAATGETLQRIKAALAERGEADAEPVTDVRMPQRGEWPEHIKPRMTYRRPAGGEDEQPPRRPGLWNLYNAPYLLLFGVHEQLAVEYACFDLGLLVENVCLAAVDEGLGTCIMAMAVRYADVLHEQLPQAVEMRFIVGVALGVPDWDASLNHVERGRCAFGEIVTFVS